MTILEKGDYIEYRQVTATEVFFQSCPTVACSTLLQNVNRTREKGEPEQKARECTESTTADRAELDRNAPELHSSKQVQRILDTHSTRRTLCHFDLHVLPYCKDPITPEGNGNQNRRQVCCRNRFRLTGRGRKAQSVHSESFCSAGCMFYPVAKYRPYQSQ